MMTLVATCHDGYKGAVRGTRATPVGAGVVPMPHLRLQVGQSHTLLVPLAEMRHWRTSSEGGR